MKNLSAASKKLIMIGIGIFGIFVFVVVGLLIYKAVVGTSVSYVRLQQLMQEASVKYFNTAGFPEEGEEKSVSLDQLSSGKYMKPLEKLTHDTTCVGKVIVSNNGGFYLYSPFLNCGKNYITQSLKGQVISDNIVTEGAGLYEAGDEYLFKGEFVNNHVSFAGQTWRIIKIDENGNLKLVNQESERENAYWDNRYNVEQKSSVGYNDFGISRIQEKLSTIYNTPKRFDDNAKKYILPYRWCIDKKTVNGHLLYSDKDCTVRSEPQYLGLVSLPDYANASIDPTCTQLTQKQCRNYNYMKKTLVSSWTINGSYDNNYEVYTLVEGVPMLSKAADMDSYSIVLYLSANAIYASGQGTEIAPYILK